MDYMGKSRSRGLSLGFYGASSLDTEEREKQLGTRIYEPARDFGAHY